MADLGRRRRRAAPRHALPLARRSSRPDRTTLVLVIVLVLTSGFIVGTTASFNATTNNAGNTFTVAGISPPLNASVAFGGTTAVVTYVGTSGVNNNANVGFHATRANIGGPRLNDGSVPPDCDATVTGFEEFSSGYTSSNTTLSDTAVPNTSELQGVYRCYALESVWPCCPDTGSIPVITSLGGRQYVRIQSGYVVKSWKFSPVTSDRRPSLNDVIEVTFNQDVATATSITAADSLCVDPVSQQMLIGAAGSMTDTCSWERQTIKLTGSHNTSNFTLTFGATTSANITCRSSNLTTTVMTTALNTILGAGNYTLQESSTDNYRIYFKGTLSGNQNAIVVNNACNTAAVPSNVVAENFDGGSDTTPIGYVSASTAWPTLPYRFDISAVAWLDSAGAACVGTNCRTVRMTLGSQLGTNTVSQFTDLILWTIFPAPAAGKTTSATSSLGLCTANPVGPPSPPGTTQSATITGGLCRPTTVTKL